MAEEAAAEVAKDKKVGRCRVGNYALDGLSVAWENTQQIRQRLRAKQALLLQHDMKLEVDVAPATGHVCKSISNLRTNRCVLTPVLHLMRQHALLLPNLDRLIDQIRQLYEENRVQVKNPGDVYYHNAWSIRGLTSLLKGELARVTAEVQQGKYSRKDSSRLNITGIQPLKQKLSEAVAFV